jgi:transposase
LIFIDESGFSQRPSVVKSWAPKGQTPVVTLPFNWKRLSAIGALATKPSGRTVRSFLRVQEGTVRYPDVIVFLHSLHRHVRGRILVLWDRLRQHRAQATQQFIAEHRAWLRAAYLPAYAPELNPVEPMWHFLRAKDLSNYCSDHLHDLRPRLARRLRRLRRYHASGRGFLKESGLFPALRH